MALNEVASGDGVWKKMPKMRTLECAGERKRRVNRKKKNPTKKRDVIDSACFFY